MLIEAHQPLCKCDECVYFFNAHYKLNFKLIEHSKCNSFYILNLYRILKMTNLYNSKLVSHKIKVKCQ